ncbi:serine/threonine protein kinase [bacterium]|nr:serine/threonine protein kinase [bacterium]
MISGDYVEKQLKNKKGKLVTAKVVKSTTGVEYAIGPKLGAGGVAKVFRAFRISDKKDFVFKEYVPSPETQRMHRSIKSNISKLIGTPFTEKDGTPLKAFVGPADKNSLIELPASKGFGYIMELVDTKTFLPVPKLWHKETYPDANILCTACINIADLFRIVHLKGWCYKDINEGNIYINNKTGEIRIIDCDNISVQSKKTIKGTDGYMAPEVYVSSTPDTYTDYFSMAVLFYRMLVGGYPLDGRKTQKYLMDNELSIQEAASTIYGSMALFAFDPKDTSNSIRNLIDQFNKDLYAIQTKRWERLPQKIKEGFIKTFSTGLSNANRHLRTTDLEWVKIFKELKEKGLIKCSCGKMNFGDFKDKTLECIFCRKKLKLLEDPNKKSPFTTFGKLFGNKGNKPTIQPPSPTNQGQKGTAPATELTTVVFNAKRDVDPTTNIRITAKRKHQLPGKAIHPNLNLSDGWMRVEYNTKLNLLSVVNCSQYSWIVSDNGSKTTCAPGGRVILKKDLIIVVYPRKLQLKVVEIK